MSTLDFSHLSTQERLILIEELWDSIDRDRLPLTEAQAIEVDRRLAQLDKRPGEGRDAFEALADLRKRFG
ncbi:addiction module protein [Oleisolibacter albus]|uniref:addiction module protein n=1 Tax=Oleisolibacter albus TaxID=2171757 RepID=UPI000DF44756|nr:addiction module protein [Oleisolibacter albus]